MQFDRPTRALLDLLSCDNRDASTLRLDLTDTEWHALARAAVRHGVAPLLHARLSSAATTLRVPEQVMQVVNGYFIRTGLENLRLYARLAPLLHALIDHAIEVIVLKGAFLAETVYGNAALRSMGDADLFVHRADLKRVDQVLRALGWHQRIADDPLAPTFARGHQLQAFVLDSAHVEIHWNIEDDASPFAIDIDGLWQRACPVQVAGVSTLALAPEDLLLHLCLHTSYNHGWLQFEPGLRPLNDIAATLRHYADRIDWNLFTQRALEWKVYHCTWLTLMLARLLLGADVPERVIHALAPRLIDHPVIDIAVELALTNHYSDVTRTLPALGQGWLTKRRQNLSPAARLRLHLWPGGADLAADYPSLRASPLRYLAHWTELLSDVLRVSLAREGRRLSSRERTRMSLARWLEAPAAHAPVVLGEAGLKRPALGEAGLPPIL